jgi:hypothetical protein
MATVSTVKNITVAYNPNDFFYVTALKSDDTPFNNSNNTNCSIYETPIAIIEYRSNCSSTNSTDYKSNCYNNELCINKSNAKKINSLQTNHDGSSERRNDKNVDYNRELLRSYNLGIGILGVGAMFYFFYK